MAGSVTSPPLKRRFEMSDEEARSNVIRVARTFIGTKYHHHGMVKGVGVDCATFLLLTFKEAVAIPATTEVGKYSNQWHLHNIDPLYEKALMAVGGKPLDEASGIADIILYFQGKQFAHGAIITQLDPLRIIHAYAPARCVVEGDEKEFGGIAYSDKKFFSTW